MTKQLPEYSTDKEVAAFYGMARETLQLWRHQGRGPKFVKFGTAVRYRKADLEEWAKSLTFSNTTAAKAAAGEKQARGARLVQPRITDPNAPWLKKADA